MYKTERYELLIAWLHKRHSASVHEVAKEFYVSLPTARRDLQALEDMGIVKRSYGRVVLLDYNSREIPIIFRQQEQKAEKKEIGQKAASFIKDGDVLFLDGSSTVLHLAEYLAQFDNLTVVTNGIALAAELGNLRIKTYSTGGLLLEQSQAFAGPYAEEMVRSINANILFFSSQGISPSGHIVDYSELETNLRRVMMQQSQKTIFLCDSSKFGKWSLFNLCHINEIDCIISDQMLPQEIKCEMKTNFINV